MVGKGKGTVVFCVQHAGVWGNEGTAPLILNIGNVWGEWSVSLPSCFARGEELLMPIE
jgi:hypothetical protein